MTPTSTPTETTERRIQARKMSFPFADGVPRHWFAGSVFATHMANGLNLVFPLGERFFVRSVRHFADRIDDPKLQDDIRGFMGQEVRHGMEHERFFEVLEAQGFDVKRFLRIYERIAFGYIEPLATPELRLAATVALEHMTASFAERAFASGVLERHVHPTMRDLLLWHAAEEIEHKAVAFDVLKKVAPSYGLRVAGLVVATSTLIGFWMLATAMLLAQEKDLDLRRLGRERREAKARGQLGMADIARAFRKYLRRDFHPNDEDNAWMAKSYFEKLAASEAGAAAVA